MFKIGDVVVRTGNICKSFPARCVQGVPVVVSNTNNFGRSLFFSEEDGGDCGGTGWDSRFFSIYEKKPIDLKTMPWKILVNSPEESRMAQEWLFSQGIKWVGGSNVVDNRGSPILTNCMKGTLTPEPNFMHSYKNDDRDLAPTIKLTFGVTEVEYPEIPAKETETQKKLKELEEQQRNIAEELAKLRESM
jgi:hypothetical protein